MPSGTPQATVCRREALGREVLLTARLRVYLSPSSVLLPFFSLRIVRCVAMAFFFPFQTCFITQLYWIPQAESLLAFVTFHKLLPSLSPTQIAHSPKTLRPPSLCVTPFVDQIRRHLVCYLFGFSPPPLVPAILASPTGSPPFPTSSSYLIQDPSSLPPPCLVVSTIHVLVLADYAPSLPLPPRCLLSAVTLSLYSLSWREINIFNVH